MGKKSGWSKTQTAVIMERDADGKSVIARVVEFPKKKAASAMFECVVSCAPHCAGVSCPFSCTFASIYFVTINTTTDVLFICLFRYCY